MDFTDDIPEIDNDIHYRESENTDAVQARARLIQGVFQ